MSEASDRSEHAGSCCAKADSADRWCSVFLGLLDYWYLKAVVAVMSLWTCTIHDTVSGDSVLHAMPWVTCNNARPLLPISWAACAVYVVGIPLFAFYIVWQHRNVAIPSSAIRRYSLYLMRGSPGCMWWTAAQYPLRAALAAVSTLVPMDNPALYFFLMLLLLQLQWGLVLRLSPYRSSHDNKLALLALSGLLVAAACGLFVSAAGASNGSTRVVGGAGGVVVAQGAAAAVNAVVMIWIAGEAWRGFFWPLAQRYVRTLCRRGAKSSW